MRPFYLLLAIGLSLATFGCAHEEPSRVQEPEKNLHQNIHEVPWNTTPRKDKMRPLNEPDPSKVGILNETLWLRGRLT